MAFSLTNSAPFPLNAPPMKSSAQHFELADQGAAGTLTDTGVVGLKFIRVRLVVKSGLGNGNSFSYVVKVDDAAALASPEQVAYQMVMTFATNDTLLCSEVYGVSQTGFRYFKIIGSDSGGTAVYDAYVDVW